MGRNYFNLSLNAAGLIVCLAAETVQAGRSLSVNTDSNNLHHERQESKQQVEELFQRLPSIENEVESLFDDVSFFSSFGASPSAKKKLTDEVEDLFHRILHPESTDRKLQQSPQQTKSTSTSGRATSFLNSHLEEAGVFGGNGSARNGGVRGSGGASGNVPGLAEPPLLYKDQLNLEETGPIPNAKYPDPDGKLNRLGKIAKSKKSSKSLKGIKGYFSNEDNVPKHKALKKAKRYKGKPAVRRVIGLEYFSR